MTDQHSRVATFRALHESGCFVMPNPWDAGSARALEQMGFPALATTSAGLAWTLGRPDAHVTLDEALDHLRAVAGAVSVPVNADFENGYAVEPDAVASNVQRAAATGIAGLSVEDSVRGAEEPMLGFELSVERIRAARTAIDETGTGVVLTARSEGFVVGRPDLEETVRRLQAYAEAGADCLYAPMLTDLAQVRAVVAAVAPKPVNLLLHRPFTTVPEARELGVRRISTGGTLARTAWRGFLQSAQELADAGTVSGFRDLPDLDELLGR